MDRFGENLNDYLGKVNPLLLACARLQPIFTPLIILTKFPSLLAPVVKMTKNEFQLTLD